jgi:hypothetical protein
MEENIPVLLEVKPLEDFNLYVKYSDGVEGKVDLSEFAGKGVFALWNEDVDIDGLGIYLKLTGKRPEDILPKLQERSHA